MRKELQLKNFKISFIGLGFVGLSTAVVIAKKGFKTIGVDKDESKINSLKKIKSPFFEPNLKNYLEDSTGNGNLKFTTQITEDVLGSDIIFICVGTPTKQNGSIDLSYLKQALKELANKVRKFSKKKHLIVIKSTIIPETTKKEVIPIFKDLMIAKKVNVVTNPEFLREGQAIKDVLRPHLIVIGEYGNEGTKILERFYEKVYGKEIAEIIKTDPTTAEMIKYANNSFLATKISFINSLANICQRLPGTDINIIANAIGRDPRIGSLFLQSGPGFGGSCLPKDITALVNFSRKFKNDSDILLNAVREVNKRQPQKIIKLLEDNNLLQQGNVISILGLAFKKNTDDIREAVSLDIVKKLLKKNVKIKVHDPMATDNFKKIFVNKIQYLDRFKDCISNSDVCIILTEWDEYKKLRSDDFIQLMNKPNLIDARRIFDSKKFEEKLNYFAIGYNSKKNV